MRCKKENNKIKVIITIKREEEKTEKIERPMEKRERIVDVNY